MHMAAALAGCRKALVGTGLAISLSLTQMGVDNAPLLFRGSISGTVGSFQSGEMFTGRRALTIVVPARCRVKVALRHTYITLPQVASHIDRLRTRLKLG